MVNDDLVKNWSIRVSVLKTLLTQLVRRLTDDGNNLELLDFLNLSEQILETVNQLNTEYAHDNPHTKGQ